jgi:hypothetical protein
MFANLGGICWELLAPKSKADPRASEWRGSSQHHPTKGPRRHFAIHGTRQRESAIEPVRVAGRKI